MYVRLSIGAHCGAQTNDASLSSCNLAIAEYIYIYIHTLVQYCRAIAFIKRSHENPMKHEQFQGWITVWSQEQVATGGNK